MSDNQKQLTDEQKAMKVADELGKFVNNFTHDPELFVKGVLRQHRTLQQGIGRMVFKLIIAWAQECEKGYYDGRNEATVKRCKEICTLMNAQSEDQEYWANTPMI